MAYSILAATDHYLSLTPISLVILKALISRVQSRKVSTVILRDARQPISQSLETRNLSSLSQCCEMRHLARFLARNILRDQYFKHRPQKIVQFFCKRVHPNPTILYNITIIICNQLYYPKNSHS